MVVKTLQSGFTIVELLIALVVLSIVVSLAAPALSKLLAEQRLRTTAAELRVGLALARSEAIKRNASVVFQGLAGSTVWTNGWEVEVTEINGNANTVSEYAMPEGISIASGPSGGSLTFSSWGRPGGTWSASSCPAFQIQVTRTAGNCNVCLYLQSDGRVITASGACSGCTTTEGEASVWLGACP